MATGAVAGKPTTRRYSRGGEGRRRSGWCGSCGRSRAAITARCERVAEQLGYGVESVRLWVRQADIDDGHAPGVTHRRGGAGRGARAGGPRAAPGQRDPEAGLELSSGRSSTANSAGSRVHRRQPRRSRGRRLGVEPICTVAAGGPEHLLRREDPAAVGPGAPRRARCSRSWSALWEANYRVYGARKLWKAARRAGHRRRPRPGRPAHARRRASRAPGGPSGSAPPARIRSRPGTRTWSSAIPRRRRRTSCGSPT